MPIPINGKTWEMSWRQPILRKLAGRDAALLDLLRKIGDVNIRRNRIMHVPYGSMLNLSYVDCNSLGQHWQHLSEVYEGVAMLAETKLTAFGQKGLNIAFGAEGTECLWGRTMQATGERQYVVFK